MELFTSVSFIFDMICLLVLVFLCFEYGRKGLVATLVQLCGTLVSIFGANFLANKFAPAIFENFLQEGFETKLSTAIAEQGSIDLAAFAEQFVGFLPDAWSTALLDSIALNYAEDFTGSAATIAGDIVEQVIAPLFIPVLTVLLFFVAFTVLRVIVSCLVRWCEVINVIPLLGSANRFLGFFAGFLTGSVDLFLGMCILWGIMAITANDLTYLNEASLNASFFFSLFQTYNPFV